jgi:hypothetical protein
MNALSRLLTRVAIRVMKNNPTNEVILEAADRVVTWSTAGYVSEEQIEVIANAVPEVAEPEPVVESEPAVEPETVEAEDVI